jgi:[ribosomal protein S18]-alanine N-acetyltransferase
LEEDLKHGLHIRTIDQSDVNAVLSIQSACREIAQWQSAEYERIARAEMEGYAGWIAERSPNVIGFLVARQVASDLEILNLAVSGRFRRERVGTALLVEAVKWANSFNAESIFLEVRESNLPARRFYELHDFQVIGRRRGYYSQPPEDAIALKASLHPGGGPGLH